MKAVGISKEQINNNPVPSYNFFKNGKKILTGNLKDINSFLNSENKEQLYTIAQYEQAKSEALAAKHAYDMEKISKDVFEQYQSREFKVWCQAFNDITEETCSPLPKIEWN